MNAGYRLKELRKCCKLNQEEFGERLGITGAAVSRIESEQRTLTPQVAKLICKEFNVSYEWLTTGQGEMFIQTKKSFVERLSAEYNLGLYAQKIIECYLELDSERQAFIDEFLKMFVDACTSETPADNAVDDVANKLLQGNTKKNTDETTATLEISTIEEFDSEIDMKTNIYKEELKKKKSKEPSASLDISSKKSATTRVS